MKNLIFGGLSDDGGGEEEPQFKKIGKIPYGMVVQSHTEGVSTLARLERIQKLREINPWRMNKEEERSYPRSFSGGFQSTIRTSMT